MKKRIITCIMIALLLLASSVSTAFATEGEDAPTKKAPSIAQVKNFKSQSGKNYVLLNWNKVKGAEGYEIVISKKDGKKFKKIKTVTIKKGSGKSYKHQRTGDDTFRYSIRAYKTDSETEEKIKGEESFCEGEAVKTMTILATFRTTRTLVSHTGGKVKATFKKGKKITAIGYDKHGKYIFKHKGRIYYVRRVSVTGQKVGQLNVDKKYTKEEVERFVNESNLSSGTKYLIWVNTYTQTEYIFKGKKGKWKVVKHAQPVATGKPATPTATGKATIKTKSPVEHGVRYWSMTFSYSIHNEAGKKLSYPKSHGCVRNTSKNAAWIYKNCGIGTRVYVF